MLDSKKCSTIIHCLVNLFHVNGGCELPFKVIPINVFFFLHRKCVTLCCSTYVMTLCYTVLNCDLIFMHFYSV